MAGCSERARSMLPLAASLLAALACGAAGFEACRAAPATTAGGDHVMLQLQSRSEHVLAPAANAADVGQFECRTDTELGEVVQPDKKGIAVDDSTLRWCANHIPGHWPNAPSGGSPLSSIRLFKAWDPLWEQDHGGRERSFQNLRAYAEATNAKVMIGTPVSCSEEDDERLWGWTKELLQVLKPEHVLGVAIGNEVELLQFKGEDKGVPPECVTKVWDGGYLWQHFQHVVSEMDAMGFSSIPVTSVFTGYGMTGSPFLEIPGKALVNSFLQNATETYGSRFAFTWNLYPYFDPNIPLDAGTEDQCEGALHSTACLGENCHMPIQTRMARLKMREMTGRDDDTLWIGETGWSHPRSGSLGTELKDCPAWSSMETFRNYYSEFLAWDLSIGGGMRGPDHVFWFTMRDSHNFGDGEHFGLMSTCTSPECKVRSEGWKAQHYSQVSTAGHQFCGDHPIFNNFVHAPEVCGEMCTLDDRCTHYSLWVTEGWEGQHWCKLTSACSWKGDNWDYEIEIHAKAERPSTTAAPVATSAPSTTTPVARHDNSDFVAVDGGEGRACRGASPSDNSLSDWVPLWEYTPTGGQDLSGGASDSVADRCRQLCRNIPHCAGVELSSNGTTQRCEVWTRSGGIQASVQADNYSCWRYERLGGTEPAQASDPHFSGVDGGFQRVCRDRDGGHVDSDYKLRTAASLHDCQQLCLEDPDCNGIEFDDLYTSPQRCELWTTAIGSTAYRPGYWCFAMDERHATPITAPRVNSTTTVAPPAADFVGVDGGEGRACRGANPEDNEDDYYVKLSTYTFSGQDLAAGAGDSVGDRCRQLCRNIPWCAGVELSSDGGCEVWTRSGGIQASSANPDYSCWRYEPADGATPAIASDPAFEGVDGGFQRVCRDKDGGHADSDFKETSAANLLDCQLKCLRDPTCKGIEFDDLFTSPQRCELWTTEIGSSEYRTGYYCMARK